MEHGSPVSKEKDRREILARARAALGVEHVVLAIHDASFPSRPAEETGRGSPYSKGARDLLEWALDRGFTGLQLGPQGETSRSNPSPYDGTAFSKSMLSIALRRLSEDAEWEGILEPRVVDDVVRNVPGSSQRMHYAYAFDAYRRALETAFARIVPSGALFARFEAWRTANASWLERDARMEAWAKTFGTDDWRRWPASLPDVGRGDDLFAFAQFVVHAQHSDMIAFADRNGLRVFGDLAIGISHRDRFARDALFLDRHRLGAPPSRTNPEGQPWGYPVYVPGSADALAMMKARATKMLSELHGVRVDHPHGYICPWVYDAHDPDPLRAVAAGARLHESPDLPDHPDLAQYAIARPEQIDRGVERYADGWVRELDDAQVTRYARHLDVLIEAAKAFGRADGDILCEVLSTQPYPLARVMQRYGLGRFRVTQKADPNDPTDVYLTELAQPGDWVMLGNHDTAPIWRRVDTWDEARADAWAGYLARRLGRDAVDRSAVRDDPAALAQPMFADLFASSAGRISVFFADLLGEVEVYNTPGVVSDDNWTLRVGNDFARVHAERIAIGRALDVVGAMATALRARGSAEARALADELAQLDR